MVCQPLKISQTTDPVEDDNDAQTQVTSPTWHLLCRRTPCRHICAGIVRGFVPGHVCSLHRKWCRAIAGTRARGTPCSCWPLGRTSSTCLLWTKSTPSRNPVQTSTSPTRTPPKPSYSQVAIQRPPEPTTKPGQRPATKENLRPRDPGKSPPRDLTRDSSRDLQAFKQARDLTARDRGNLTHDLPRDWSST